MNDDDTYELITMANIGLFIIALGSYIKYENITSSTAAMVSALIAWFVITYNIAIKKVFRKK